MKTCIRLLLVFLTLALTSCGTVCIGPFGDQTSCYGTGTTSGTASGATSSSLSIVVPTVNTNQPIAASTAIILTAANGSGNYQWRIADSTGTSGVLSGGTSSSGGVFAGSSITYTAPAASAGGTWQTTIVVLTDSTTLSSTALAFTTL